LNVVKPYQDSVKGKKEQVEEMFDSISFRYDLLNKLLSVGIDRLWRKRSIALLKKASPLQILDIATGTGDFAIQAMELNPDKITGIDISEGMLEIGRQKIKKLGLEQKIVMLKGDSENLQFNDNTFDAVTVAFGVRNFENLGKGLKEMHRVLKPGGKAVILEFSNPSAFPVKQLFGFYFRFILPFWGRLISGNNKAYTYLPESVKAFPDKGDFTAELDRAGFKQTEFKPLTFGVCSIYTGTK
jgi:demethylmenaquinone methyltransferase/2-methoxy-6-polyprenyl-1,4-benzoquinol methylase